MGDKLELTFNGPLRNNGADKLPSLDWKIAFSGLTTKFTSRAVSTGDNFFINLGGQDFEAGREAVAQLTAQAREGKQKGVSAVGLDPLGAVKGVKKGAAVTVAGAKATSYTGAIDLDKAMDEYERLSQSLPTTGASAAVPQGRLTPEQRAQVKRTFGSPRFEAALRRGRHGPPARPHHQVHHPAVNREGAGGITGGRIEYRVEYSDVGEETTIVAPKDTQPIGDFARELQRILSRRRVTHRRQVEAVWRRGAPASARGRPSSRAREALDGAPPRGDLEHRPDEHAVHVAHERVRLDVELEHVAGPLPAGVEHVALEALVAAACGREGGEVVRAPQERRAGPQRRLVERLGDHSERPRSNGEGVSRVSTR